MNYSHKTEKVMDNNVTEILLGFGSLLESWIREAVSQEVSKALEADHARQKPEKMYTRDEVCQMLSISLPTLWARTKAGDLQCKKVGRRVLYPESEVKKALEQ